MMKKRISLAVMMTHLPLTILTALMLCACASDDRKPAGGIAYEYAPSETTRQNPNSYFMDSFNVQKERKARPATTTPFFFKHCDEAGRKAPWSSTSYDCDYSM